MTVLDGDVRLVLCGLGGQGIVFLSRVVAGAVLEEGREVLVAETHGMAQRGGAVEAHVKIGAFESSLVRRGSADVVLALDASRIDAGRALLGPDGVCFASGDRDVPGVFCYDAAGAARSMDFPRGANLVLLGYAAASRPDRLPSAGAILQAIDRLSPEPARDGNRRAFAHGAQRAGQRDDD